MLTRRGFLKSSSLLALSPTVPLFLARTARGAEAGKDQRVLVVVQLDGGNDALNTVVPFKDPDYPKLRPTLKIAEKNLLKLNDALGLHPALKPLERLWQGGNLAVLPGVGYPNPNRSHFESMAIWHTARFDPEEHRGHGWLGRALDPSAGTAYVVGGSVPGAVRGRRSFAVNMTRPEDVLLADAEAAKRGIGKDAADDSLLSFVRRQAVEGYAAADRLAALARESADGKYPQTRLGQRMRMIARLLKADLPARVYYTSQGGFDTHATQSFAHTNLLNEFAGAVAAFLDDLGEAKLSDRVALLAFSEFGRTIKENGSAGTDHGTAGCVFLGGPGIKGGVAGTSPSLTELEKGEPKMTTDFRGVYATVLETWLGLKSRDALSGAFEPMPLFNA